MPQDLDLIHNLPYRAQVPDPVKCAYTRIDYTKAQYFDLFQKLLYRTQVPGPVDNRLYLI